MVRSIVFNSLAKLAEHYGTEPVNIIEIQWAADGNKFSYADRTIGTVRGRVLEISGLDNVVQVSDRSSQSAQIHVTLDDTDGSIKAILDTHDIHKRPCWVYQWFSGLELSEKFLIFKGQINTPLQWKEGDRTVSFDVILKIEDVEVGFSMDEGEFFNIPRELVGKPWPLCFGTVVNVPAFRGRSILQGTLATGIGIHDFTIEQRLEYKLVCPLEITGFGMSGIGGPAGEFRWIYSETASCAQQRCETRAKLNLELTEQTAYEYPTCIIYGGNLFQQGRSLTLNIGGGYFTGYFDGETFHITGRRHPRMNDQGNLIVSPVAQIVDSDCGINAATVDCGQGKSITAPGGRVVPLGLFGFGSVIVSGKEQQVGDYLVLESQRRSTLSWGCYGTKEGAGFFWANPGSKVTAVSDEEIIYIVNLLPSTVLRVAAKRTIPATPTSQGSPGPQLMTVPSSYYTVRQVDYRGNDEHPGYTGVTEIVFNRPLSTRIDSNTGVNEGWSDDIYVTLTSSVGPNTVDILKWFIEMYTAYTVDDTSFDAVRAQIDNYPSHFALLTRKNIQTVLQEIAYQARCALWLKDDKFYIKYLSLEPSIDETITVSDIEANSLVLTHTPTEDLITKYVAAWTEDYAVTEKNQLILRYNVAKYGLHEQTFDYYIYNIADLVRKSATFWLIRRANTWRKVLCKTPLSKLKVEVFDTMGVTLPDFADGEIKAVVEKANYNSDDHTIDFELWTPVRSGSRTPYIFAFPAGISETLVFPTLDDTLRGFAGGGALPNFSTLAPEGHAFSPHGTQVTSVHWWENDRREDHGTKKPSDIGDTKPTVKANTDTGVGGGGTGPDVATGSNGCCDAAKALAQQALATANKALKAAQKGGGGQSGDDSDTPPPDPTDNLPEICGGNCMATVKVQHGIVDEVKNADHIFGTREEGQTGLVIWYRDGSLTTDCYTFNSSAVAHDFCRSKIAEDVKDGTVGQDHVFVAYPSADLGIDTDPQSPNYGLACPEPEAGTGAMIGKKRNVAYS